MTLTAELLAKSSNPPPDMLDFLEFKFKGISLRVYGILHGITGGLNQEYRNFIKQSIKNVTGLKIAEKGMKQLYPGCGIHTELEDWLVLRNIDAFVMGFQLLADPRCLWMTTVDALRERYRKHDPYIRNKRKNISDLGESPYFHYLAQNKRRELAGFEPSYQAISADLTLLGKWYNAILPRRRNKKIEHPQWRRILLLERLMHIPARSIHMLYYAVSYAKEQNKETINVFVGETHNTDMLFLANNMDEFTTSLSRQQANTMKHIIKQAEYFGRNSSFPGKFHLYTKKINYLFFLLLGTSIPINLYYLAYSFFR